MPVGSIREMSWMENGADFEWRIPASEIEELERGEPLWSPFIYFEGWEFQLVFDRRDPCSSSSPVQLSLHRHGELSPAPVFRYWLGAVKADRGREEEVIARGRNEPIHWFTVKHPWLPFSELRRRMQRSTPFSDTLSFIARLRTGPWTDYEMRSLKTEQSTQTDLVDISFLIEQSRKYLLHASDHDVLFRVRDKVFRAHKSVLRSRSPVFEAMFQHEMRENVEDTVTVEDVDPDCFGAFLAYVYTGEVENLSAANALGLYYAGDKYDFPALKRMCVDVLKASLSTSLVCDVITVAGTHGEEELLDSAMAYVTGHLEELKETTEWQQFVLSNPLKAKEISSKAEKRRRTTDIQE